MSQQGLKKSFVIASVVVIAMVVAAFIYFSWEVTSPTPPETTDEERSEWTAILSSGSFTIDKSTSDVRVRELGRQKIKYLVFGPWNESQQFMEASFFTADRDFRIDASVYLSGPDLVCDIGGSRIPLWYEDGEYPVLVLQTGDGRLIFNPE